MELMAFRKHVCSLANLEKLGQKEKFGEEFLRDLPDRYFLISNRPNKRLKKRK